MTRFLRTCIITLVAIALVACVDLLFIWWGLNIPTSNGMGRHIVGAIVLGIIALILYADKTSPFYKDTWVFSWVPYLSWGAVHATLPNLNGDTFLIVTGLYYALSAASVGIYLVAFGAIWKNEWNK